jgi:2-polyprenyl-3-methyl-5-hydroxy-6-metoxy-1,4-benzoquinol methylase
MGRYVIRGGRLGYERLKVLARARRSDTAELLRLIGVRAGMHCLDLGCGGGDVTLELARLTGSTGRVVGIDLDEVGLDLARGDAAEGGLTNIEFRSSDVRVWSEPATYDLVFSRNLLHHLPGPWISCAGCGRR